MTVSKGDVQAMTWLATRLRDDTHGCGKWDAAGTYAVISELVGQNLAEAVHRVIGHALDPEARTPGSIRRPFVPKRVDEPGRRQPAKAGQDCKRHPGEYVGACRPCNVEHLDAPTDPVLADDDRTAGRALREQLRARRLGGTPEPSPAPDAATSAEPPAPPAVSSADEGDDHGPASAGEPQTAGPGRETSLRPGPVEDRPETACAAPGCFRPTRDGICDRCRAAAIALDEQAANQALIAQLQANERARAHTRPEPSPEPPRRFTSADIDHDKVRAAMTRAAKQRSTP